MATRGRIAVGEVQAFGRAGAYRVCARGFCAISNEGSRRVQRGDDACRQKEQLFRRHRYHVSTSRCMVVITNMLLQ